MILYINIQYIMLLVKLLQYMYVIRILFIEYVIDLYVMLQSYFVIYCSYKQQCQNELGLSLFSVNGVLQFIFIKYCYDGFIFDILLMQIMYGRLMEDYCMIDSDCK